MPDVWCWFWAGRISTKKELQAASCVTLHVGVQDAMEAARALQVKAQQDVNSCTAAVEEAGQKLQWARQKAAESAEAAWRRQLAEHEAAVRQEQEAYQAQQVTRRDI